MSQFKRSRQHQQFARALPLVPDGEGDPTDTSVPGGPAGPTGPTGPTGGTPGGPNTSKSKPTSGPTSTSKPPPKPTKDAESSKTSENTDTETTKESAKSSDTATNTKSNSDSSSSRTTVAGTNAFLPTSNGNTFLPFPTTDTNTDLAPTTLPSSAAANNNHTSGAINTSAIIGGIAGGLGGIALIGVLISFILRRVRSKRRAEEFDASQFRRSAMVMDTDDPRPISLFGGRFGGVAPSIRSSVGPGMAGHGAYQPYADNTPTQPDQQYDDYHTTPTTAAALQPRQQYTYGEDYDHNAAADDDLTNGAYSEQPQPQAVYNLEAYGDYEAYSGSGVQYPTAAHQGRHAQRDDDPYGGI